MGIIVYGSKYGTARQYAEELAKRTGLPIASCDAVHNLSQYETIVYIGALYAGGIFGMKKAFAGLSDCRKKRIILVTVGLADPMDQANTDTIRAGMKRQLSGEILEHATIFHLRGGIDYARLSLKHKTMMSLLYQKAKRIPEEKRTPEVKAMIETYGQRVSFLDYDALNPILAIL